MTFIEQKELQLKAQQNKPSQRVSATASGR
jgi:hypothetical protein